MGLHVIVVRHDHTTQRTIRQVKNRKAVFEKQVSSDALKVINADQIHDQGNTIEKQPPPLMPSLLIVI